MDAKPIGAALNRDIGSGEKVEAELDAFVSRRDKERRLSEAERAREELWAESVRRHEAARDAELREQWCEYHLGHARALRANLEALAARHEQEAQKYLPNANAKGA